MRRSHWIIGGFAVGALAIATSAGVGCKGGSGAGGAGGGASQAGAQPPARPTGAKPGDSSGAKILAINKIFIGTTDRMGTVNADAWKNYGYNLDNQITTATTNFAASHCTPNSNASPKQEFPDGNNGIDNSFGKNLLPIIKNAAGSTDIQATLNKAISDGKFTIMVDL